MKKWLCVLLALIMLIGCFPAAYAEEGKTMITDPRTCGLTDPLGINTETPVFAWKMVSNRIGARQTAYRIVVKTASGEQVWDSGKVESSLSTEIRYEGSALAPQTAYAWEVTVTDENGNDWTSEKNSFETAFMNGSQDAWAGAQWIGSAEYPLDAASAAVFDLSMTMQLDEENPKAGIVFGGGDYRLTNKAYNVWGTETDESCVRLEIDVSDPNQPLLNVYAVGFPTTLQNGTKEEPVQKEENDPSEADYVLELAEFLAPEEAYKPITVRVETAEYGTSNLHIQINGQNITKSGYITLNPLGADISYNSYPNLYGIGFAVPAGSAVTFTDVKVMNPGQYSDPVELFGKETGATYSIFEGLDGVKVSGDEITVGKETDTLVFADPSWGSMPIVRTEFKLDLEKKIEKARLYVSAEGLYDFALNGSEVTDTWFNPGDEEYRVWMPYQIYDVTALVQNGDNAMGAQLTEGWWTGQTSYYAYNYNFYGSREALLARLDVTYEDGTVDTVVTDPDTWSYTMNGPVRYASLYHGERYDSRLEAEVRRWSEPVELSNPDIWKHAVEIPQSYSFELVTRDDSPAHVVRSKAAVEALGESREGSGTYIYDMGENVIGVPRIEIPAEFVEKGKTVIVRYAEILYPDLDEYVEKGINGMMMVENLRAAFVTDFYTAGDNGIVIEPHFTFHGYRYLEISGLTKELPKENISMLVLSSIENTATYESSNELVNRLFANVQNSQTSNFLSIPTDCPQRNERLGWTGDAQVFSTAASYNADVYNFYHNWMKTFRVEQGEDGTLPTYAPCYGAFGNSTSGPLTGISWEGTIALVPYYLYRQTGKTELIEDNFDAMLRYMDFLAANPMKDAQYLTGKTGPLADWLSVEMTNNSLVNNAVYVFLMDIIQEMAVVIGRDDIAAEYAEKYELTKKEWNDFYVDPETGIIGKDTQTAYATPLRFGVVSEENIERAVEHFVDSVERAGFTLTTGFSGTPNLVPVLTEYGYVDEAYKLFEQTEYASWLYPVTQGATSVWERWNSYTVEGGFNGNNSMNSFNHFSLGAITEWMMAYQLGIMPGEEAGYKQFILQPTAGGSFSFAKGTFESDYGTIASGWTAEHGAITEYTATIPANTNAKLYLPITEEQTAALELPEGITYLGREEHNGQPCAMFSLIAGNYSVTIPASVA